MANAFSNVFKTIADASATGGGNIIRDGNYRLLIEKCSIQKGHTGVCFVAEFRVMESADNGANDDQGRPVKPNAVGTTCSMVCNLTKHESAAGNIKAFLQGALGGLGYIPEQITEEVIGDACSEANPLRGVAVIAETYRGVNKGRANPANAGKPLTLNKWKPITQTTDDVAKMAEYLDTTVAKADTTAPAPAAVTPTSTEVTTSGLGGSGATKPAGSLLNALKKPAAT